MAGLGPARRNGPRAGRTGQRAEPAVAELDVLATNSPMESAVPDSHDFIITRLNGPDSDYRD